MAWKGMLKNWARITLHAVRMLLPYRIKESVRPILSKHLQNMEKVLRPEQVIPAATAVAGNPAVAANPPRIQPPSKVPIRGVSVVIPTKNAGPMFEEVLEEIQAQQCCYPVSVTIVDSGSTDETLAIAQRYGAKIISIDPQQFNHGLTRNLAIENTSGEIVVLLTQDAVPGDAQLIRNFIQAFDDQLVAGVYGRQVPRPEADLFTRRNLNRWLTGRTKAAVNFIEDMSDYCSMTPYERYKFCNFDNVCSAVRRSVWKEIPFRANEFAEDLDWSKRVLEAGWRVAYEPTAFVVHSHDRSISYEYKRTYLCHRKLYSLFGFRISRSLMDLMVSVVLPSIWWDWTYATKHETNFRKCLSLWIKAPIFNLVIAYARYAGAKDEKLLRERKIEGV